MIIMDSILAMNLNNQSVTLHTESVQNIRKKQLIFIPEMKCSNFHLKL